MIPAIDIWRVASLMLKRYGDEAMVESAKRAEILAADGDAVGAAIWHRVIDTIGSNKHPGADPLIVTRPK